VTHTELRQRLTSQARDEQGMALLIAVIVLLLMSALGLQALQHAGDEASGSGRSRRKDATLYAAESGLKMLQVKLSKGDPASAVTLNEPALITDGYGNPITVVSGAPVNGTIPPVPVAIMADPNNPGEHPEGNLLNIGNPGTPIFRPVRADVTALDIANGMVHLQAQFKVYEGSQ
jgi:PilX N-terminal